MIQKKEKKRPKGILHAGLSGCWTKPPDGVHLHGIPQAHEHARMGEHWVHGVLVALQIIGCIINIEDLG
jgi:hypothetical protein